MKKGQASETAYRAALARARHQVLDTPRVFDDPVAHKLLRPADEQALHTRRGGPVARGLRMALAVRSRVAEDALDEAVQRGVAQYVVLGAGYDTFALRNPYAVNRLRVFEVDHPDSQAAKRAQMARANLERPHSLTWVPVDFGARSLAAQLAAAGFDATRPAFFAFLGVSMYLEHKALDQTLGFIGGCAPGSEVVFDYAVAPQRLPWLDRMALRVVSARCARMGEPWKSLLDPDELRARLVTLGFSSSRELPAAEITAQLRARLQLPEGLKPPRFGIGRMVRASV